MCIVPSWSDRFLDSIAVNMLDCRRAGAEQKATARNKDFKHLYYNAGADINNQVRQF